MTAIALSSSIKLLVHEHTRCAPHALSCRGDCPTPWKKDLSEARGIRHKSCLSHRCLFTQVQLDRGRSWQCFAESEKSELETAETSSSQSSAPSCCNEDGGQEVSTPAADAKKDGAATSENGSGFQTYGPGKQGNRLVALASVSIAVGLFLSGRLAIGGPGLPQLAAEAISYEEAKQNGRPTVVEFYADWCEVCKEMAHEIYQVEQEYRDQINFVMLNVDNSKWDGELDDFGVEGIPHFAFLDKKGNEEGNIVGRLPTKFLKENLAALARGDGQVPHTRVVGLFSSADSRQAPPVVGPRSHSQMS